MRRIVAVVALIAAAVLLWPNRDAVAGKPCAVPKAWGALRTYAIDRYGSLAINILVFEAPDGTVRALNRNKCEPYTDLDVTRTE